MKNIAEILRNFPKGTKLYSPVIGECEFIKIDEDERIRVIDNKNYISFFNKFGRWLSSYDDAECLLFPSKENRDWDSFCPFKDGDIIFTISDCSMGKQNHTFISIFKEFRNNGFATYIDVAITDTSDVDIYHDLDGSKGLLCFKNQIIEQRLATEKEKKVLFDTIKAAGYKWNEETKILEKLIKLKFKVGDKIVKKTGLYIPVEITSIGNEYYHSNTNNSVSMLPIKEQDDWELVPTPKKFDISTLKPFESKVLVRYNNENKWCGSFFSHIDEDFHSHCYKFVTIAGKSYPQMIPYEGNEHLRGTNNDCDDFYKNW